MRVIDILTDPWAIIPEKLFEIQEIYRTHLRGEKIDIKAIESSLNELSKPNEDKRYEVIDGVAVIPIQGIIAKRMNLFSQISGGVSTELVGKDIKEVAGDDRITGIILDIDSPGGTVDGTQELVDIIFAARTKKPVVAHSDGMIASAAYWIGSAAGEIYISSDTVEAGSIGVVAAHVDYSEWEKKVGIKTTEIYAGKYKRIASQYKPLSEEGREYIQDRVDYIYTVFVDSVARNRETDSESVLKMADGQIFIGKQAQDIGLVDGIMTFEALLNRMTEKNSERGDLMSTDDLKSMSQERAEELWTIDAELRAEFQDDKDAWLAYFRAERNGQCSVIGGRVTR